MISRRAAAVVLAGVVLYAIYLGYTGPLDRNPDAGTHLLYVRYVAEHHALPARAYCNVCHHPPVYYLVAAVVYRAFTLAGSADPAFGLQLLALALFTVFVGCAALVVERLAPPGPARLVATALVVFWPSSVVNSVRIGNDVMVYALAGGVLLSLTRWYEDRSAAALRVAAVLVVLGLFTKASAVALAALLVAVVGLAVWRSADRRPLLRAAAPALAIVLVAAALPGVLGRDPGGSFAGGVLGSAYDIKPSWRTPRTARYYLTFDPQALVASPYVTVSRLGAGEPTYWNHLVKSSLFGTRRASLLAGAREQEPAELAGVMNHLLLAALALLVGGQLLGARRRSAPRAFCLVAVAAFVGVGLGFHLLVPYGFHADFRFVHPVVVPLAILYAQGAEWAGERWTALRSVAHALAGLMVFCSVLYFLPTTWHERPARSPAAAPDAPSPPASSGSAPPRAPRLFLR